MCRSKSPVLLQWAGVQWSKTHVQALPALLHKIHVMEEDEECTRGTYKNFLSADGGR